MKTILNIIRQIDRTLTNLALWYIDSCSSCFNPKPIEDEEDDDEPILFI